MMRADCIQAVERAIGRALRVGEAQDIESRIRRQHRTLASEDPQAFAAMTPAQRLIEAGARAAQEIKAEHAAKQRGIALNIRVHDEIKSVLAQHPGQELDGLDAVTQSRSDGKWNVQSAESKSNSITNFYLAQMADATDYLIPTRLGLYVDPEHIKLFLNESFGKATGDAEAKAAAESWLNGGEAMRLRQNANGANIHRLENWAQPTYHNQLKVAKAGPNVWTDFVLPMLNRDKYYNEDGSSMTDAQVRAILADKVQMTIATGGLSKTEPGKPQGPGARINRHSESRWLHFKGPDEWIKYQERFGDMPVPAILVHHVETLAKDIALVETFGTNPDLMFKFWKDASLKSQAEANPVKTGKYEEQAQKVQGMYDFIAGKNGGVAHAGMAQAFDTLRSWMVATMMGSSVIPSITDEGTIRLTAAVNNLDQMQLMRNQLATLNPANATEKRMAQRAGLGLQTVKNSMNRWGADLIAPNVASKVAGVVVRMTGLVKVTEARRRGWGVTQMGAIGQLVKQFDSLAKLDPSDNRILLHKGFTETDWQILRQATLQDWGGGNTTMLTPQEVMQVPGVPQRARLQAATKLLGAILEETDIAVVEPGAKARKVAAVGGKRGTWGGELTRSIMLFKTFPLAMIQKHMERMAGMPGYGGKSAYLATLIASTTVLGAAALQFNEVISGRDPRNMAGWRFWTASMLKGGSLGIYGDFLFSTQTRSGRGPIATLGGPVLGLAEEVLNLTQGNLVQLALGEDTHAGAEAAYFLKHITPGQNLWYTKAPTDHLIFQQLQEMVNPGYSRRVQQRARREFGSESWWVPGQMTPDRAPDLGAAWNVEE